MGQLSARQQEILSLIAEGLSNKDIAHRLDLTTGTVKQHLNAIFFKLGVSNRTWAAAIWQEASQKPLGRLAGAEAQTYAETEELTATASKPLAISAVGLITGEGAGSDPVLSDYSYFYDTVETTASIWGGELQWTSAGIAVCTFGVVYLWLDVYERAEQFTADLTQRLAQRSIQSARAVIGRGREPLLTAGYRLIASSLARTALKTWFEDTAPGLVRFDLDLAPDEGPDLRDLLLTAPFMGQAQMALAAGRAIWLSVEAWPPRYGKSLLDALGAMPPSPGCQTIRLRLPMEVSDDTAELLGAQIASQVAKPPKKSAKPSGLSGWLRELAGQGPLQLLIYGQASLADIRAMIAPDLMTELDRLPVLIVLMTLPSPGAPRLAVRVLSSRGERPVVGRVHAVHLDDGAGSTSPADILALIDQLDRIDRRILDLVGQNLARSTGDLSGYLDLPSALIQQRTHRLVTTGLVLDQDGVIRLRDQQTEDIVVQALSAM